jgi:hypothetical protein
MYWRQNPQRVAWIILIANFLACCTLAVATPLGIRHFVLHATRPMTAAATALTGTVQLQPPRATDPTAVTERRNVPENSQVATDATAKGLLTISTPASGEQVLATVQLFPGTVMTLEQARTPRFAVSPDPDRIVLRLQQGRLLIATQPLGDRAVQVEVNTPHATVTFGTGTFVVSVEDDSTLARARSGTMAVQAAGRIVTAGSGERVNVSAGRPPDLPVPDALNLVLNGQFVGPLAPAWEQIVEVEGNHPPGRITQEVDGRRRVVRFTRREEDGVPNRVGVKQVLDRDVQGYDSLILRLDLKLLYQSVPGGGYLSSEYPVMIDLHYTDVYGNKDLHWYQGFYYLDLPPGSPWRQPTGEKIPLGVWYTFESPNLFEKLRDNRPARINAITIYASGHDYDSMISDVALSVR